MIVAVGCGLWMGFRCAASRRVYRALGFARASAKEVRRELKAKLTAALNLVKDANERASAAAAKRLLLALRRQVVEPHFEPFDHGYKDLKVGEGCLSSALPGWLVSSLPCLEESTPNGAWSRLPLCSRRVADVGNGHGDVHCVVPCASEGSRRLV